MEHKRVCAVVDLDAAVKNLESMREKLDPETKMLAVIKANGYGHGAVKLAEKFDCLDYVFGYAVATAEEALQLRQSGLRKPILILGYTFPECYEKLVGEDIRPTVFRLDMARELSGEAVRQGKILKIHIKVDTGMSRIGIFPDDTGIAFVRQVMELPGQEKRAGTVCDFYGICNAVGARAFSANPIKALRQQRRDHGTAGDTA